MNPALIFLLRRSVQGRLRRMLGMVRQPKYLLGLVVSAGWMALWIFPWLFNSKNRFSVLDQLGSLQGAMPAIQLAAGLALAAVATLWWLLPFGKPSIGLRETELQILLASPVPRHQIIRYALLKAQPPILLGSSVMTFFVRAPSWDRAAQHFLGIWFFFTILDLHSRAKRLWLGRQREIPRGRARRRIAVLVGLLAAGWAAIGFSLFRIDWGGLLSANGFNEFLAALSQRAGLFAGSPGGWIVWPFSWLPSPLLLNHPAFGTGSRLWSLLPPVGLLILHEEWVVGSQTRFEEATLEAAKRASKALKGETRQARKSKKDRSQQPFPLKSAGAPELAVVWKNLTMLRRTPLTKQLWVGLAVAAAVFVVLAVLPTSFWVFYAIPLMTGVILSTFVPMLGAGNLRNDLRADLKLLETIRPWPIPSWRMVAAQVLSPVGAALLQSVFGAGLVLSGQWATLVHRGTPFDQIWASVSDTVSVAPGAIAPLFVATAFPMAMALACFSSSLHNLAALAFPGWVPLGTNRKELAHAMGSNLVLALIQMIGAALSLIPGAALIGGVLLVQLAVLGVPFSGYELPLLSLLAAIPPLLVSAFFVVLGGSLWETLDPSRELLGEG